jgi:AcrR family transcriptional regulator
MASSTKRIPLTKHRVLAAAVQLADRDGIEALTMRKLAEELGVEAMSIYYHVPNKEAVLDGVVDLVFAEANESAASLPRTEWKAAIRARILTARAVLLRHKWAPDVIQSRAGLSASGAIHVDAVVGTFRSGGFTFDEIHHALHVLGSRLYGFTQEIGDDPSSPGDTASLAAVAERVPNLLGMFAEIAHDDPETTLGWCDAQFEFEFALDLILDGLEQRRHR